jgi:hypothetical protein
VKHIYDTAYGSYNTEDLKWCHRCQKWIDKKNEGECEGFRDSPCHVCRFKEIDT